MTEYSKSIFEDNDLLRKKLTIYLGSIDTANKYSLIAQIFFAKGGKEAIGFEPTWNWFAFIFSPLFLLCRRIYLLGFLVFPIIFMPTVVLDFIYPGLPGEIGKLENTIGVVMLCSVPILIGMRANYFVIKRFEKFLDMQNDQILPNKGSLNIFGGVFFFAASFLLGGAMLPNSYLKSSNGLENALMQKEEPKDEQRTGSELGFFEKLQNDWENEVNKAFGGGSARSNKLIVEFMPEVLVRENSIIQMQGLIITSNVDNIKIDSVSVNKGNCLNASVDRVLKFGESLKYNLRCNPRFKSILKATTARRRLNFRRKYGKNRIDLYVLRLRILRR